MALHAMHGDAAGQRAPPPVLDDIANGFGVGRFADDRCVPALALFGRPLEQFVGTVDRGTFLVPCNQQGDRAGRLPVLFHIGFRRRDEAGNAALHVDGTAAIHHAVLHLGGEGRQRPGGFIACRHNIRVSGKHQMRAVAAKAGIEIVDIRRIVVAEGGALAGKAELLKHLRQIVECSRRVGGNRRAADHGGEMPGGGRKFRRFVHAPQVPHSMKNGKGLITRSCNDLQSQFCSGSGPKSFAPCVPFRKPISTSAHRPITRTTSVSR